MFRSSPSVTSLPTSTTTTTATSAASRSSGWWRTHLTAARAYAVTRIGLGTWIVLDPSGFGAKWFTDPQDPVLTASMLMSVGGRDAAIGVGLLVSDKPRRWLLLAAFCDVLDAFVVYLARSRFTERDFTTSLVGALSYAAVALLIAALSGRRTLRGARS